MLRKRIMIMALTGLVTLGVATAADDPIAQRRLIMRENGRLENAANNVILGKYFPEKAVATMQKLQVNLTVFPAFFPEGSDQGNTRASPTIWTNMDDFRALAASLVANAKAAEAAAADGQDAFAVAWQEVVQVCAACHDKYTRDLD